MVIAKFPRQWALEPPGVAPLHFVGAIFVLYALLNTLSFNLLKTSLIFSIAICLINFFLIPTGVRRL